MMYLWLNKYKNNLLYITLIVLLNAIFARLPLMMLWGCEFSPLDFTVGIVYVTRDFAQREVGHKVIVSMFIGGILSYFLSNKLIAVASLSSFVIAELVDWSVYTFTKRPLSKRILFSASLSSPVDSIVFLAIVNQLNYLGVIILTVAKLAGVLALWFTWRCKSIDVLEMPAERVS